MLRFFARRLHDHDRGFTLIELLIVIAIIAILAAVLIPNFLRSRAQAQESATQSNLKNLGTALESYFVDKGQYPTEGEWDGGNVLVNNNYIRAVPVNPKGNPYTYADDGSSKPQTFTLCDPDTYATQVHWGYTPGGGLARYSDEACQNPAP
jgi:general secretion pathway protein G